MDFRVDEVVLVIIVADLSLVVPDRGAGGKVSEETVLQD